MVGEGELYQIGTRHRGFKAGAARTKVVIRDDIMLDGCTPNLQIRTFEEKTGARVMTQFRHGNQANKNRWQRSK